MADTATAANTTSIDKRCRLCGGKILLKDHFCASCGAPAGNIVWSLAGVGTEEVSHPSASVLTIPEGGTFYLVAANQGTINIPVELNLSQAFGLTLGDKTSRSGRNVPPGASARFELLHISDTPLKGTLGMRSRDDKRDQWWERDAWREELIYLAHRIHVHARRWFVGSPVVLFPAGIKRQRIRVWNDAPEARVFDSALPPGYRATCYTLPLERNPQSVAPHAELSLTVLAEARPGVEMLAETEWLPEGPSSEEPVTLRYLPVASSISPDATAPQGPDIVIALDFGTCNTSVRVRWRRTLVSTKPAGTVDAIGNDATNQAAPGDLRYPTCLILDSHEASFSWGIKAQDRVNRNDIAGSDTVIDNLKTDIRNGVERYTAVNPRWTNEYLLGRYFEQVFASIERYLAEADPRQPLQRSTLDIRYVVTRPVLDANDEDAVGKGYEAVLLIALQQNGVSEDRVTFLFEPEAAALGIARRRRDELLALPNGTPIAVIDSGGGTTDVAVARVRHQNGEVTLSVVGTYRLELLKPVPGSATKDHEFGGNVLDEVMAFYAANDTEKIADADEGSPPTTIEIPGGNQETTLRLVHRRFKERFVYGPRQYYNRPESERGKDELLPFKGRDDLSGVYVDHGLFAQSVAFPLLKDPMQELLRVIAKHQVSERSAAGFLPTDIKQLFFVGGTSIDSFVRQAFAEVFPAVEARSQVLTERLTERADADQIVDEKLNAVVNGAVWYGERLGQPSPLTLTLRQSGRDSISLIQRGDTLLPAALARTTARATELPPGATLEIELLASDIEDLDTPLVVARTFYRNSGERQQEATLRCQVTEEEGCVAELILEGKAGIPLRQWEFLMTPSQR